MAIQNRFTINGLIDTNRSAMDNLTEICNSSGCWFTFDNVTGLWSVVINKPGTSSKSFGNHNIIGSITINGLGFGELYNSVKVTYPRADIKDNEDYIRIALPNSEWNPNEIENTLDFDLPLVNNQVQAQLIAFRELKQSRVNKMIRFQTDYSNLGVKAGDIIDVTNAKLGMSADLYRVISVTEEDDPDQGLVLSISALYYEDGIYDETDLVEYILNDENGIFTAGDIGQPLTPQITKYELDSRPRFVVDTVVPSGRVEAMEFWVATGNIGNTYSLAGTQVSTNTGLLSQGQIIRLDIDNIAAGNVFVKTRGINSTTSGPYSPVGSLISYQPLQVAGAIGPNTGVIDNAGGSLLGLLGANILMSLLKKLMEDGEIGVGSIFKKIFDLFKNDTGVDLLNTANNLSNELVNYEVAIVNTPKISAPTPGDNLNLLTQGPNLTWVVPSTGWYCIDIYANFGADSYTPIEDKKALAMLLATGASTGSGNVLPNSLSATSDYVGDVFDDLDVHKTYNLTAGTYHVEIYYGSANADFVRFNTTVRRLPPSGVIGSANYT